MFEGLIQSLLWLVTSPDYLASPLLFRRGAIILRLLGTLILPVAILEAASTLVPTSFMGVTVLAVVPSLVLVLALQGTSACVC